MQSAEGPPFSQSPAALRGADEVAAGQGRSGACASLSCVPSTLLIPLAGRAFGDALYPALAVDDVYARRTLEALGEDGQRWLEDRASVWGTLVRTQYVRTLARAFLEQHPQGHVLNLGCGLSQYFQWLDNGRACMTEIDMPEVMALRQRLLPPLNDRHRMVARDLSQPGWWEAAGMDAGGEVPLFILLEGVSMYLDRAQVRALLRTVGERAPGGSMLVLDALSEVARGPTQWHRSLRHTGACIRWGLHRQEDLQTPHQRLKLAGQFDVMAGYDWSSALGCAGFRFWTGVPFYGLYVLAVGGGEPASVEAG